jgi:hypothetical protein
MKHFARCILIAATTGIFLGMAVSAVAADRPRAIVFGLDETGSYAFREKALGIAQQIIVGMKPGEVFYLRRITEASYHDQCAAFRLELPDIGTPPANRFNPNAHRQWQRKVKRVHDLKRRAVEALGQVQPLKAKMTDIWGFVAAAADRFAMEARLGRIPVVVITSDMKDNVRLQTKLDLVGAEVLIAGYETDPEPDKTRKFKESWTRSLKECNAGTVTFLPPDCRLDLAVNP